MSNQIVNQIIDSGATLVREDGTRLSGGTLADELEKRKNDDPLARSGLSSEMMLQALSAWKYGRRFMAYSNRPGNPAEPRNIQDWDFVTYTSGTTGAPKGHGHRWSEAEQFIDATIKTANLNKDTVTIMQQPCTNVGVYCIGWPTLAAGGTIQYHPFNHYTWCSDIERIRPDYCFVLPRMLLLVSLTKAFEESDLSSVKCGMIGANFIDPEIVKRFAARGFGWKHIYGSTELLAPTCISDDARILKNWLPGFEYKLEEDGNMLARWNSQPEWHNTGDTFKEVAPGELQITGRKSAIIKHRDFSIHPEQVETVARYLPTVTECVLIQRDGKLVLRYEGTATAIKIKSCLSDNLEPHLVPTIYEQVEELPRNNMGKVIRG